MSAPPRFATLPAGRGLGGASGLVVFLCGMLAAGAIGPEKARGQSLLASGGLGFPVEPLGARARGMGSLGVGLFGSSLLPGDPAISRALPVPLMAATYQPTWSTYTFDGTERDVSASRFPLLGVAYPVSALGGVATLTFGSFLDMNWRAENPRTLDLGSESMEVKDAFRSRGGISTLRLGWAQDLHETLAVAISAGSYLGEVERTFVREFTGAPPGAPIDPYRVAGEWRFSAPNVTLGAVWDASDLIRLEGSVNWSGRLHAEPTEGTESSAREIDLPTEFRFGASGALSPRLFVNVGASYADWTPASDDLIGGSTVGPVWSYGGGAEWEGPRLLDRTFPIRIGYRRSDLPFRFGGADPTESAFALGLGLNLLQAENLPLAVIDIAFETGSRDAGALSEDFSRATVTVRVAGN